MSLDDKYVLDRGVALMTGTQALVRLPLAQSRRDRQAGLRTRGFISGYRGSPLGGYDRELWRAKKLLDEEGILFRPGVNEDLAATAVWGTQQLSLFPSDYDGVFAMWYGKGPGLERSGDPVKHGNYSGTAKAGGVLAVVGDDPAAKSSTIVQQSELTFASHAIPVLYPASVGEIIEYGLLGWAMSRFAGLWVGLKCVNETLETDMTVAVDAGLPQIVTPPADGLPPGGVNYRGVYSPTADDALTTRHRVPLAKQFARLNGLDRVKFGTSEVRFGILTAGKAYADVCYALGLLGIDPTRASELRLDVYKVGMIWPLEESGIRAFASDLDELLVVEEKKPFLEPQAAVALYASPRRPRIVGKCDDQGRMLLPSDTPLSPAEVAVVIGERLGACGLADGRVHAAVAELKRRVASRPETLTPDRPSAAQLSGGDIRTPYFCSGCPHNTSTKVPQGSVAFAGIGCHTMAARMDRSTLPPSQMGGEGANWIGIEPFVKTRHVFQNLGDGTYFHSGLIAIRAAVAAGSNITYKILYNDAVAMTGGQPIDGQISVAAVAQQVVAEGVARCVVVSNAPDGYRSRTALPPGVSIHDRDELDAVQRLLRDVAGVTVIIYDQMCAAEKRRKIKRARLPPPTRRVFINEDVCEGCGDCSTKSNCVSILPKETSFGRKRAIDQSSCNEDLSCTNGFCPSFLIVRNATPRRRPAPDLTAAEVALPEPIRVTLPGGVRNVMVTGIGGTGVITIGAVLAMAARLEGRGVSNYNMTGLAQKGGPVYSHLRFTNEPDTAHAARIDVGDADVIIACDVLAALAPESLQTIRRSHTHAVINSGIEPSGAFQLYRDSPLPGVLQRERLARAVGEDHVGAVDATQLARLQTGDKIGANMIMVGYAYQKGLLPVGLEAIERAIELNAVSVDMNKRALQIGRQAALDPEIHRDEAGADASPHDGERARERLESLIAAGCQFLSDYQDTWYAQRYATRVREIWRCEQDKTSGHLGLALAVARSYRKLLAYKDEYEVARLHTAPSFLASLNEAFDGEPKVSILLAPPVLGGRPGPDGNPTKREFGPWIFPILRLLARSKALRGSAFDPFGYSAERKTERSLIREYEAWLDEVVAGLSPHNSELAVRIASLPEQIRGYGRIKMQAAASVRESAARMLAEYRNLSPPSGRPLSADSMQPAMVPSSNVSTY